MVVPRAPGTQEDESGWRSNGLIGTAVFGPSEDTPGKAVDQPAGRRSDPWPTAFLSTYRRAFTPSLRDALASASCWPSSMSWARSISFLARGNISVSSSSA